MGVEFLVALWGLVLVAHLPVVLFWCYPLLLVSSLGSLIYSQLVDRVPFLRRTIVGKWILITGCDSGFGNLAVRRLDAMGCHVFANCLTQQGADSLKAQCSKRLRTLVFDITNEEHVLSAAETVSKELDGEGADLWAVINNAGVGLGSFVEGTPMVDVRRIFEVNFFGLVRVTKAFLPLLRKNRASPGRVVNISSVAGRVSEVGMGYYCASKHAVEAFSDALRREVMPFGVQVTLIEPGYMKTAILSPAVEQQKSLWNKCPESVKRAYGEAYHNWLCKNMEVANRTADDPSLVVTEIVRSCYAKWPAIRIPVGYSCLFLLLPIASIPQNFLDARYYALGPQRDKN